MILFSLSLLATLLVLCLMTGCTSLGQRADEQAAAADASLAVIDHEAKAADADLAGAEAAAKSEARSSTSEASPKSEARNGEAMIDSLLGAIGTARAHLATLLSEVPRTSASVAGLRETTKRAIADKDDPWRAKLGWAWLAGGGLLVAAVVLWWTEKARYALGALVAGLALIGVALFLGWTLDHKGIVIGGVAAAGLVAIAVEWVKNPNDGWPTRWAHWFRFWRTA